MQPGLLPLFPLQVVLLPGSELPLHIFVDRYKEMMAEVMRDRIEFGVILASDKGIANTGCTATVERVLRRYPDGRMDIMTQGRRRFEIVRLDDEHPEGEPPNDLVHEANGRILVADVVDL